MAHVYKHQPPLPASPPPPPAPPPAEQLEKLTAVADVIGGQLQNHHQGFLPNARQQVRSACLADVWHRYLTHTRRILRIGNGAWQS